MSVDITKKARSSNPNARAGYYRPVKRRVKWESLVSVVLAGSMLGVVLGVVAAEWSSMRAMVHRVVTSARSQTIDAAKRSHLIREGER